MAVLIVGAGMVGSQAARQLLDRGETPILFDLAPNLPHLATVLDPGAVKIVRGDMLELAELIAAIQDHGVDRIIHTASFLYEGVLRRPYAGTRLNLMGTLNVVEAARQTGVGRVVFCSAGFIYHGVWERMAGQPEQVVDEDIAMRLVSDRPRALYAVTKLSSEYIGLSYGEQFGIDFIALRYGGVFGPWKGPVSGVPGRFVDQFVRPGAFGRPIVLSDPFLNGVAGGGSFLYCKDAAKATLLAAFARPEDLKTRVYNINMSRTYPIHETIDIAGRLFPGSLVQLTPEVEALLRGQRYQRMFDITRARNELGYTPDYELERAFSDYAEWLRAYERE
ncbi:MAG: NAD(P)-dependent oxidoreductase [Chloroflexota bacterium]